MYVVLLVSVHSVGYSIHSVVYSVLRRLHCGACGGVSSSDPLLQSLVSSVPAAVATVVVLRHKGSTNPGGPRHASGMLADEEWFSVTVDPGPRALTLTLTTCEGEAPAPVRVTSLALLLRPLKGLTALGLEKQSQLGDPHLLQTLSMLAPVQYCPFPWPP